MRASTRKRLATVATVLFAVTVPGTVLGVVPYRLSGERLHPPLAASEVGPARLRFRLFGLVA
jgi:hypothetical protein